MGSRHNPMLPCIFFSRGFSVFSPVKIGIPFILPLVVSIFFYVRGVITFHVDLEVYLYFFASRYCLPSINICSILVSSSLFD